MFLLFELDKDKLYAILTSHYKLLILLNLDIEAEMVVWFAIGAQRK